MEKEKKAPILLVLAIVGLCGAGAWISGSALRHHADIWGTGGSRGLFADLCRATAPLGFACTADSTTRWSAVPLPLPVRTAGGAWSVRHVDVPVAFVGLAYFVFLATWFLFVERAYFGVARRVPLLVARLGGAISLVLLAAMTTRLLPLCAWCVLVHLLNLALVRAVGRACRPVSASERRRLAELPLIRLASAQGVRAAGFALLVIAALWLYRRDQLALGQQLQALEPYKAAVDSLRRDPAFLMREFRAQPSADLLAGPAPGNADAARLVVFTDFACPACRCAASQLAKLAVPAFDERLRLEIHHYPLDAACNDSAKSSPHPGACDAAYAAEAARLQGGDDAFAAMHHALFAHRGPFTPDACRELAAQIGLDLDRFTADFAGPQVRNSVRADVALAHALGVEGTPVMFLNGRRVTAFGADNPVFWQAAAEDWVTRQPPTASGQAAEQVVRSDVP